MLNCSFKKPFFYFDGYGKLPSFETHLDTKVMQHLTVLKGMQIGRILKRRVIEITLALETCERQCTWKMRKRIINKKFKFKYLG